MYTVRCPRCPVFADQSATREGALILAERHGATRRGHEAVVIPVTAGPPLVRRQREQ
jgi:hypothetical protein